MPQINSIVTVATSPLPASAPALSVAPQPKHDELKQVASTLRDFQSLLADVLPREITRALRLFTTAAPLQNTKTSPLDFSQNQLYLGRILLLRPEQVPALPLGTRLLSTTLGQVKTALQVGRNNSGQSILQLAETVDAQGNLSYGLDLGQEVQDGQDVSQLAQKALAAAKGKIPEAVVLVETSNVSKQSLKRIQELPLGLELQALNDASATYVVVQTDASGKKVLAAAENKDAATLYFGVKK